MRNVYRDYSSVSDQFEEIQRLPLQFNLKLHDTTEKSWGKTDFERLCQVYHQSRSIIHDVEFDICTPHDNNATISLSPEN
jgi:hypothetical protein